jgi:hypothetical protein
MTIRGKGSVKLKAGEKEEELAKLPQVFFCFFFFKWRSSLGTLPQNFFASFYLSFFLQEKEKELGKVPLVCFPPFKSVYRTAHTFARNFL